MFNLWQTVPDFKPSTPNANVPKGSFPVGESDFNSVTRSEFSRRTENTRDILPTAIILFRITILRCSASSRLFDLSSINCLSSSANSSLLQTFKTAISMSVTKSTLHQYIQPTQYPFLPLTLLSNKGQTPRKHVHEIRQPVRVRCAVELSNVHDIIFVFQHSGFVVVHIKVIGGGENSHHWRKRGCLALSIHTISIDIRWVWQTAARYYTHTLHPVLHELE